MAASTALPPACSIREWASANGYTVSERGRVPASVLEAYDALEAPPSWLFENGPAATHGVEVEEQLDAAVRALAAHDRYLSVLDPDTPVREQARKQVENMVAPVEGLAGGNPVVGFTRKRP